MCHSTGDGFPASAWMVAKPLPQSSQKWHTYRMIDSKGGERSTPCAVFLMTSECAWRGGCHLHSQSHYLCTSWPPEVSTLQHLTTVALLLQTLVTSADRATRFGSSLASLPLSGCTLLADCKLLSGYDCHRFGWRLSVENNTAIVSLRSKRKSVESVS